MTIPVRAAAALGRRGRTPPPGGPLPPPLDAAREDLETSAGRLAVYRAGPANGERPLLLVHSVNAAASAYEVRPLFERYAASRPVVAVDLPGYGFSARDDRIYTPRLMTDAILAVADLIRNAGAAEPVDALALSLSSEFLARAAAERPDVFRSVALVSPTGFDRRGPLNGPPGSTRAMPALYKTFTVPLWRRGLFDLLTSRISIRYFLEKTWGSKAIDEGLLDYDVLTTDEPGAEFAPYSFIGGYLFSNDISRIYAALRLPVWMVHGVRGDFVDYSGKRLVEPLANWSIEVMETGALPHFEIPDAFVTRYNAFLGRL